MLYFISLSTVFLLNSVDGNKVKSVERNEHYNQVIPVGLDLFLGDQSNFSLIEYLVNCEMIGSECLGTFYNRIDSASASASSCLIQEIWNWL